MRTWAKVNAFYALMFSGAFAAAFTVAVSGSLHHHPVHQVALASVGPSVLVLPLVLWMLYLRHRPRVWVHIAAWASATVVCAVVLVLAAGWLGLLVVFLQTPVLASEAIRLITVAVVRRRQTQLTRQNTPAEATP